MNQTQREARARKAGDVGAAGTLLVSGLAALKLLDEASEPTPGDLVAWILLPLAAALLVRMLLVRLW